MTGPPRPTRYPTSPRTEGLTLLAFSRNDVEGVLRSVGELRDRVDEVVVVDSSSAGPRERLRGALRSPSERLCPAVPLGNVDLLRPFGLAQATQPWVLVLESDEHLSSALRSALPTLTNADGYVLPRREQASGGYTHHLRLFRRARAAYSGPSHAYPVVAGRVQVLPRELHLIHDAPPGEAYWRSADRARRYLLSDLLERPYDGRYLTEARGGGGTAPSAGRPLAGAQILLAHLMEAVRELLRSGSPGLARSRWEQGRARQRYLAALTGEERAWLFRTAEEVRAAGGLTRFLGLQEIEYVLWLTDAVDPDSDAPALLEFLLRQRAGSGRTWHGDPPFRPEGVGARP